MSPILILFPSTLTTLYSGVISTHLFLELLQARTEPVLETEVQTRGNF